MSRRAEARVWGMGAARWAAERVTFRIVLS
jgi:hypothetical protein